MPDDYFRIRLIASLLETCGVFFNRGAAGKKLDYFLSFFQYYIYTKDALPMDIEFIVQDIFVLCRPQWRLASNLDEATKAFQLAVAQDQKFSGQDKVVDPDEGLSGPSTEDEMGLADQDEDSESEEEDIEVKPGLEYGSRVTCAYRYCVEQEIEQQSASEASGSQEEAIVVTRPEEELDPEEEADFDREYAKMMAESLESRKLERKPLVDIALPVRAKAKEALSTEAGSVAPLEPVAGPTMAFAVLTKRGNRQQVHPIPLAILDPKPCLLLTPHLDTDARASL
jgi:regulator of nonsense transcripts 2